MFKKCLSAIITIVLAFSFSTVAFAAEENEMEALNISSDCDLISTITSPSDLEAIIATENINIPEGYHIEKIETFIYNDEVEPVQSQIQPFALIYTIKNVRRSPNEFYYVNEYDSDWFDGPCSANETYTRTSKVKVDIGTDIGNSTVSAAVGFSISNKYSKSATFTTNVAANKKLNVRIHTNYKSTQFDIYNQWTGSLVEKDAWVAQPIGLVFRQFTYSK